MKEEREPTLDKNSALTQIEFIIQQASMNPNKKTEISELDTIKKRTRKRKDYP
ncbi:MAG: hypothetical protein WCO18_01495 [bacterium]